MALAMALAWVVSWDPGAGRQAQVQASAVAQNPDFNPVNKPSPNEQIPAGSTYKIEWTAPAKFAGVTIKIALIGGETQQTQVPLLDIASGIPNSALSYEWKVPADIGGKKFYGLVLTSEANAADWQFSNPFVITAGSGSGSKAPTYGAGSSTVVVTTSVAPPSSPCPPFPRPLWPPAGGSRATTHTTLVVASTTAPVIVQPTESAPVTVPQNGAGQAKASVFAVLGGVALAALL
ncbi:conserved hypothetical protein [Verticillium alfalfae VaMs.102]|uniref:Yeast cell wall synthesis Kre9/Knh1-like N-terminal domain-containing protein n=1 Tax=Verticillium alfalfae (strain VaMs.102 / ATCC MYA-4576 / FGSC 10136) TaxID=526221 RepID=C9SI84_VERA1|nr:conserved hypothetical protein [Verticillium alfalfae VaMs.102]EEY18657.1 conserved hypothetical protein [Verticillium alfalfae VaMs.102]